MAVVTWQVFLGFKSKVTGDFKGAALEVVGCSPHCHSTLKIQWKMSLSVLGFESLPCRMLSATGDCSLDCSKITL